MENVAVIVNHYAHIINYFNNDINIVQFVNNV